MIQRTIALAVLIGLGVAAPASAVIDGVPDGTRHPYVGAVDGQPGGGQLI